MRRIRKILEGYDDTPEFPISKLLPWEMEFCQHYISNNFSNYKAMQEARPNLGSTKARLKANEVLKRPEIQEYIRHQLVARLTRLSISSDVIAQKYWEWANVDITKFVDVEQVKIGRKLVTRVELKQDIKDLPPAMKAAIKSITTTRDGKLKVELIDKKASLDSLCKLLGFNEEENKKTDQEQTIVLRFDEQDAEA